MPGFTRRTKEQKGNVDPVILMPGVRVTGELYNQLSGTPNPALCWSGNADSREKRRQERGGERGLGPAVSSLLTIRL